MIVAGEDASTATFTAPTVGPSGETLSFDLVVGDPLTDSAPDRVQIKVLALTSGPVCSAAVASPQQLWPPNHQLVKIVITGLEGGEHRGNGDLQRFTIRILSVTQDEPVNGTGDGDTGPDAIIEGETILLRAERAGNSNGRVYRITFRATDDAGGTCTGQVWVGVPHNSKATAVDDGQHYDATKKQPKPRK